MPAANNGSNRKRLAILRRVIAEIGAAPDGMTIKELAQKINMTKYGVSRYCESFRVGDIFDQHEVIVHGRYRACRYRLIADQAQIEEFLAGQLIEPGARPSLPKKKSMQERMEADPKRHFHIASDDERINVRIQRVRVFSDPLALPREFFASVAA